MSGWTTPADLRAAIERLWLRGALPSAVAAAAIGQGETGLGETRRGETQLTFPMRMPLKRPRASDLGAQYEDVKQWVRTLEAAAAEGNFDLEWEATNNRAIGHNRVPVAAAIASADVAVRVIGRSDEAVTLGEAAADSVARFPTLTSWVVTRAPQLLQHVADWPEILSALDWFVANPRSGRYLRQIEVAGLHTKFFETKRAIFAELLDIVLPVDAIDASATGVAAFERRYGLIAKPTMIRWRTLDERLAQGGLADLSVRLDAFARLDLAVERIYIIENEVTFLAFPPRPRAIAIFGAGYGIERLAEIPWLAASPSSYWGDIDTHGFAILDQLRAILADVRSILMDEDTLLAHRRYWTREPSPYVAQLDRLNAGERSVYDALRFDRHGIGVRLEQERIPIGLVGPH